MLRFAGCLLIYISLLILNLENGWTISIDKKSENEPDYGMEWDRIFLPWHEILYPPSTISNLVEELRMPEVSGVELAEKAQSFNKQWKKHQQERNKISNLLSSLAGEYEKKEEYAKALALYERLWVEFPEQQKLISEIKRWHALAEVLR